MESPKPRLITAKKGEVVSLAAKMDSFFKRKASTGVSWKDVSSESLKCALHAALESGMAIMFSSAAGGTGVCLTLFKDKERQKEYVMTAEELTTLLDAVAEAFGNTAEDLHAVMAGGAG